MKLTIELVPQTSFYKNARSILSKTKWENICRKVRAKANNVCQICGGHSNGRSLDCHEVWSFDEENHIQKLVKIIALCERCHEVKHIGLAEVKGNLERAKKHFMTINNISKKEADKLIAEAFNIWNERSQHNWKIDTAKLLEE